jgi:hypothetical protein
MECVRTNPAKRPESMSNVVRRLEIAEHGILHHSTPAASSPSFTSAAPSATR